MLSDDFVLFLIVIALITGLGAVIFLQDRRNRLHKSFLFLSLSIAVWVFANYMEDAVTRISLKDLLLRIDFVSAMFMAYYFFNFCYIFSADYIPIKKITFYRKILFAILILFSAMTFFSSGIISGVFLSEGAINPVNGNYYFVYVAYLILTDTLGLAFLISKYWKEDKSTKKQTASILIGSSLVIIAMVITNIVLPSIVSNSTWFLFYSRLGVYSVLILIGFMGYAIAKNNFLNMRLITAQIFSAAIVLTFFVEIFAAQSRQAAYLRAMLFLLALYFSRMLIVYVELEVKRKKELEIANNKLEIAYDEITDKNDELEIANREISQRKEQLQKLSDNLAISNDKLKIANEKLKQLDQAKSDFFARASHDLRTPITGIKGYVSMILEGSYGAITAETKNSLEKVFSTADNMLMLVEDFLLAAQLDAGGMQYTFSKCKIEDICQQIMDTLYPKAKGKGLYLDYKKTDADLPELLIDGKRIRESISNLVDNAIKYTEKGGVTVKLEQAESSNYEPPITTEPDEKITEIAGPVVRITISDTGIGIPKDGMHYLFARFSRGDTTRLKTGGHGLGLYVCKGMIEGNGGKVWAESDGDGKGSRFIVELPINPPEAIKKSKLGH